jgi:hypothetical protein
MTVNIPYPYFELGFDAKGKPADAAQLPALLDGLAAKHVTDLFVVSHGWNNDQREAHDLYEELFKNVKAQEKNVNVSGRTFAVAGIIWPSKKFDAAEDAPKAASLGGKKGQARLGQQIDTLRAFLADGGAAAAAKHKKDLERAKKLIPKLDTSPAARREFSAILLARLPKSVAEEGGWYIDQKVAKNLVANDTLLKQLGSPPPKTATTGSGGGAAVIGGKKKSTATTNTFQGAAGIGDFFKGVVAGASNLLNYVTYYQMKDRAGAVGRTGVNEVLRRVRATRPSVRVHLVGHSFGCRVVTAAATGPADNPGGFVDSMTLLQAAFSHYAFSAKYDDSNKSGFFRNLVSEKRVRGPVVITHTRADKAVGLAYAVASRVAGQIAAAIGDKNDPFGGLGSNGAQKTAEARDGKLPSPGGSFDQPIGNGMLTNLLADGLIASHSDVRNPSAAFTVLSVAAAAK